MFSPTTTASSTTIPSTSIKVKREIIFIETSKRGRSQKPPIKEIGIPKETQAASLGLRNKAKTIKTRTKPKYAFSVKSSIRPRKITDSSFMVVKDIPGGIVGFFFFIYL